MKRPWLVAFSVLSLVLVTVDAQRLPVAGVRERISINDGWRFTKDDPPGTAVSLLYDVRPDDGGAQDDRPADAEPEKAASVRATAPTINQWILPTANPFIADATRETQPAAWQPRPRRGLRAARFQRPFVAASRSPARLGNRGAVPHQRTAWRDGPPAELGCGVSI